MESQVLAGLNALHLVVTEEGSTPAAVALHWLSNLKGSFPLRRQTQWCVSAKSKEALLPLLYTHRSWYARALFTDSSC